jgi:tRNA threonylcarbamoyl adenosine modification protein YeaZ
VTVRVAIDAATDRLSVAADRGAGAAEERVLYGARRHAGALLGQVDEVLGAIGASRADITLVAVANGPGSFTGLRVAFAAAKAMARDGVTLVTAPSLLLRAVAAASAPGQQVLATSSALRGEVYAGVWRLEPPSRILRLFAPRAIGLSHLPTLPSFDRAVGDGPPEVVAALGITDPSPPSASVLLRLIDVEGGAVPVEDPALFEPDYGRPAEAQAKWEREHGRPLPYPGR